MKAKDLKNAILQLAVQGKLVPQVDTDIPASQLIEDIRKERIELVKTKKIKPCKNDSIIFRDDEGCYHETIDKKTQCIDEKLPFDIPNSWQWVRLENICKLTSGQDLIPSHYNNNNDGIPYITGASNINRGNILINRWTPKPCSFASKGDLLLTCKGTIGTMAILSEEKVHIARQIMAIKPNDAINTLYIQYFLTTQIPLLKATAKSMIPGISRNDILHSLIPLPP